MALDRNYVYRYRCSDYGGLICEANFVDFDPITDPWMHTDSADCREAERQGLLIGERPKCRGGGHKIGLNRPRSYKSFSLSELNTNQKVFMGSTTILGAFTGYKLFQSLKTDKVFGAVLGLALGLQIGYFLSRYIK